MRQMGSRLKSPGLTTLLKLEINCRIRNCSLNMKLNLATDPNEIVS